MRISRVPDIQEIVEELSLRAGDVINNLRTSLDHLMWQLAQLQGPPRDPLRVKFRVCKTNGLSCTKPDYLGSQVWGQVHEFQPCKGVNGRADSWPGEYVHQAEQLAKLSNHDKHRNIVDIDPAVSGFSSIPTRLTLPPWIEVIDGEHIFAPGRLGDPDPDAEVIDLSRADHRLAVGAEVARVRAQLWGSVETIGFIGFARLHFTLPQLLPLLPTLQRLSLYCHEVLTAFTPDSAAGPSVGRPMVPTNGQR
ncbi:hypothetical protein [Kitasatospora phosalacinea]|uniref:hypothetical protein n=1 Tax=Kitasatospora phosalacinea TaxID=2065 RepID=UPI00131E50FF|nr:hypothetical protein [Kitasatospora phosalacinea]